MHLCVPLSQMTIQSWNSSNPLLLYLHRGNLQNKLSLHLLWWTKRSFLCPWKHLKAWFPTIWTEHNEEKFCNRKFNYINLLFVIISLLVCVHLWAGWQYAVKREALNCYNCLQQQNQQLLILLMTRIGWSAIEDESVQGADVILKNN